MRCCKSKFSCSVRVVFFFFINTLVGKNEKREVRWNCLFQDARSASCIQRENDELYCVCRSGVIARMR